MFFSAQDDEMRRTPAEPSEPIEPAEPLSYVIKGCAPPWTPPNPSPLLTLSHLLRYNVLVL